MGASSLALEAGNTITIPTMLNVVDIHFGWKSTLGIDASIICLDDEGSKFDSVGYAKLRTNDGALVHKTNDPEHDTDAETITLNLERLDPRIDSLWPVINIFAEKKNFGDVRGAFFRITDGISGEEFCKFNLELNYDGRSNGNIIANLKRTEGQWTLKTRGYFTSRTPTDYKMVKHLSAITENNYSTVKILDKGQYNQHPKAVMTD